MGRPFALRPRMQSITLEVIVRVVFGVDGAERRDELRRLILTVAGIGRNPFVLFATRGRRLGPNAPWARFIRARDTLHAALAAEIRQRRDAHGLEQRSDVLSALLLARDDQGRAMTDDEVRDELVTLLFAGHETTATSLSWAFDLLLRHPRALSRLVADLDRGASEYLDATINETFRIRPVIALVDRRARRPFGSADTRFPRERSCALTSTSPQGSSDVRLPRWRALRRDRPESAHGSAVRTPRRLHQPHPAPRRDIRRPKGVDGDSQSRIARPRGGGRILDRAASQPISRFLG